MIKYFTIEDLLKHYLQKKFHILIILKMRYGLYNGEEYTQREIARQLGISRSYVSRIEKGAVEKLRKSFS